MTYPRKDLKGELIGRSKTRDEKNVAARRAGADKGIAGAKAYRKDGDDPPISSGDWRRREIGTLHAGVCQMPDCQ